MWSRIKKLGKQIQDCTERRNHAEFNRKRCIYQDKLIAADSYEVQRDEEDYLIEKYQKELNELLKD